MAKCATQSKRRAIFQVRVDRRERKVVSEGKVVLSGRQRRMVAEQLDSLHTVADCGRHCQSHFSLGLATRRRLTRRPFAPYTTRKPPSRDVLGVGVLPALA